MSKDYQGTHGVLWRMGMASEVLSESERTKKEEETQMTDCVHRWIIDRVPSGGLFHGHCANCGISGTWPELFGYTRKYGTKATSSRGGKRRRRAALTATSELL